ncbi:hypothetical protein [Bradyrhizobium cenepequi]|uniref:hypothetical protein n=1 Tax=Bradyrhizobium cenepequi TaxID=2821403 RepID=UPI001CE344BB|nr:hypothetical protein [Bradyrhizobium cenepequi]MCA6112045.1 hypothetical protein [Bradyrhizobium cenepequi]
MGKGRKPALREGANFFNAFKVICTVQSRAQKEIGFRLPQITLKAAAIPARFKRGVSRSSRT